MNKKQILNLEYYVMFAMKWDGCKFSRMSNKNKNDDESIIIIKK
jgi:hypothetical protein